MKKEKEARKCLRKGEFEDAIDKLNEAAHELRHNGEFAEAIALLEEGSEIGKEHRKLFEWCLCQRTLSEIHAEQGNRESCLRHILTFRALAEQCRSRSQEQLSYHVEAWCLQQLYYHEKAETKDIEKAIQLTIKSRELVDLYKHSFKDSEPGGKPKTRKAQLFTLEAQLESQVGNNKKALELLDKTAGLLGPNDKALRFEMLRTKCSIAPIDKRVDIAELMDEDAPEDKKAQTLCELSHQYVLANRLGKGYTSLAQAHIFHEKQLTASEFEDTVVRICIIYRLVKYSIILEKPDREPKISLCQLHEAVGDLYDKYFQTMMAKEKKEYRGFVKENILKSYERMLEFKQNNEDALRAYQAIALVYDDLDDYEKSIEFFKKRLDLLLKTGAEQEKILDTRVSIFTCLCKLESPGLELEAMFDELSEKIFRSDTKRELYESWANYWFVQRNEQNAQKWKAATDAIPNVLIKNEDDETDILYGRLSNDDILEKCREENELLKLDHLSEYQLTKKDEKGETILHKAAQKSENEAVVEKLCKRGCDVNARDNGGWTPLAEAVEFNEYKNARILIRYGADVNSRSSESFVSNESQKSSDELSHHYRLTPLMEACSKGFIDIAQLLIENKANVDLRDSCGWKALQHMQHCIHEDGSDEKQKKFAEYLKNLTSASDFNPPINIPVSKPGTSKNAREFDDSPPDDAENDRIFDMAASRKRRNSNSFTNYTKRRQRNEENIRYSSSPPTSSRSARKRDVKSPMPTDCFSKRPNKRTSSPSLKFHSLNSKTPRTSISPTANIRSASSLCGEDDDVQVVGYRSSFGKRRTSMSSNLPSPSSHKSSSPMQNSNKKTSEIAVKCCFDLPSRNNSHKIQSQMLLMSLEWTIAEAKSFLISKNPTISQFKIADVSKQDGDKCSLTDELLLSHLTGSNQLTLVFQLIEPPAHEVYQNDSKNPIAEVTERLKLLSTESQLDLSTLFLDTREILEVTRTFKKCHRPEKLRLDISFCEFSNEDEENLQAILDGCSELKIANTLSKNGFSGIFENTKRRLEKLDLICLDFRDESQIIKILKSCPELKTLKMSGIWISSTVTPNNDSILPSAINALQKLRKLDLSFNSSWISEQSWSEMLKELKNLEELTLNETKSDVQFESGWIPNLSSFWARGSELHWDSLFELFSVLEKISLVDVCYSTVDPSLPEELKKGNPRIEISY